MEQSTSSTGNVILIGISGPSSAGKTTLAHLLSQVFPSIVRILHADDFCREIEDLPIVNGYPNADGPDGVDFVRMAQVLDYIKANAGKTPPDFQSWQADVFPGQDEIALKLVSSEVLAELCRRVQASGIDFESSKMVVVDGLMLYNIEEIRRRLDARLFLRLSHETTKHRRMTRQGYGAEAKPGEFWKTEDYFEKMVWWNYKTQHASLFQDQDVEGVPNEATCTAAGIVVQPGLDSDAETTVRWATNAIITFLELHKQKR